MLGPTPRRLVLAVHLTCSIGWIGAVIAYLALAFAVPLTEDPITVRAAWISMELIGWYAIVPLAVASLATGILLALASRWGLLRHYWVLISFIGTLLLTTILVLHMPDVTAQADLARSAAPEQLRDMGSDIPHALIGLVLLLGILVLNIFKPRGMTRYGWRREHAARQRGTTGPITTG
jgi:hypothetical protein